MGRGVSGGLDSQPLPAPNIGQRRVGPDPWPGLFLVTIGTREIGADGSSALMWTTRYKKCGALHRPSHHSSCTVNNERAGESAVTIVDGMRWRERLRRVGIRLNGIRFQFHPLPFTALFIDQQSKVTMFVRDRPSFPRD